MSRAALLVLDSLGVGALPDAARFGDAGADTFGHIARHRMAHGGPPLALPNLLRRGLGHAARLASGVFPAGLDDGVQPEAAWGVARERSTGKDTTSGHWEMCGAPVDFEWGYFTAARGSFPPALLEALVREAGLPGVLGDCRASGTAIVAELGAEHLATGKPIVYTSADSVLQIAAHEQAFGLQRLYRTCEVARRLVDRWNIARVIARPFRGDPATGFTRTADRHDWSVPPPPGTLLDRVVAAGGAVVGIGKIPDIFAGRGITRAVQAHGIEGLFEATCRELDAAGDGDLVFTNFVDFDQEYGHRRDPAGYARALEAFDALLPSLDARLAPGDLVVLTADHGNDPTWPGSDHTREHVPVLAYGHTVLPRVIGCRDSFADIGQTVARWLGIPPLGTGEAFLQPPTA